MLRGCRHARVANLNLKTLKTSTNRSRGEGGVVSQLGGLYPLGVV